MSIEQRFDIPLIASWPSRRSKSSRITDRSSPSTSGSRGGRARSSAGSCCPSSSISDSMRPTSNGHDFAGKLVADPFMGGGTPLIEANRVGCDVLGLDINPMAAWIVREEIEHLDHTAYRKAASKLVSALTREVGEFYRTDCPAFDDKDVPVKYFLWVKTIPCDACGHDVDLFPGYLLADDTRHPRNVLVCADCGELNEVADASRPGNCTHLPARPGVEWPCQARHLRLQGMRG